MRGGGAVAPPIWKMKRRKLRKNEYKKHAS